MALKIDGHPQWLAINHSSRSLVVNVEKGRISTSVSALRPAGANQKQSAGFGYGWTLVRRRSQVQKLLRTVWIGGILIQGRENFDTIEVDAFEPLLGFVLG